LRDEELVDLIAASGGRWIFIGMESIDPVNLADVSKSFNKPSEYAPVLERLARRNIYAITSFIFGLDNDTPGVADRTLAALNQWPPTMPVFGPLTPLPGTPLYAKLGAEGRLTRPKHWLNFAFYKMAHTPLKITIEQAQGELDRAWTNSYSPRRNEEVIDLLEGRGYDARIMHFIMRLFFRGIYYPQMNKMAWAKLLMQNRKPIFKLIKQGAQKYRASRSKEKIDAVAQPT
jgi:radical SAM superfamily enzyme YgiQ (UPF0313 family)